MATPCNTAEDFWSHVQRTESGCWLWTLCTFEKGYGAFKYQGKQWRTHRLAWTLTHGPIPDGLQVNHHCDNPTCVNPAHLYLGTQKQNCQDAIKRNRAATGDRNGTHLHPESVVRGERHHKAKLSDTQRGEVVRRHAKGEVTMAQLGREYGVTRQSIWAIVHQS